MFRFKFSSIKGKIYFTIVLAGTIIMTLVLVYSLIILDELKSERLRTNFFEKGSYNSSMLSSELNAVSGNLYSTANIISRFDTKSDSILELTLSASTISLLENNPIFSGAWIVFDSNKEGATLDAEIQVHYYYSLNRFVGKRNLSSSQRRDLLNSPLYTVPKTEQIGTLLDIREESYTGNVFDNIKVISITTPIISGGIVVGALGVDIPVSYFNEYLLPFSQYTFSMVFNDKGRILSHINSELVDLLFADYYVKLNSDKDVLSKINSQTKTFSFNYKIDDSDYLLFFFPFKVGKRGQVYTYALAVQPSYAKLEGNENTKAYIIIIFILGILVSITIGRILSNEIYQPFVKINRALRVLASGDIDNVEVLKTGRKDEISKTYRYINTIVGGFRNVVDFAEKIKKGDYDYDYESFGEKDKLGNTLLEMQVSIKDLIIRQNEIRLKEENRNWINVGISIFSNTLRKHSKSIKVFASDLIQELVEYVDVQVGGIYLMQKDKRNRDVLELTAAYAYDRNKFIKKTIMLKEGLVGTCAAEEQIVYLRKVPKDYISIASGLGSIPPKAIILMPLKVEDRVLGVLELGSIKEFEKHHIEFLEKLSDNIALTIASVTINERTDNLVEQLRSNSDELRSQEEELRQNLEELQAIQDESSKRQFHLDNLLKSIDNSALTIQLNNIGKIIEINEQFLRLLNEHESKIIGTFYNEFFKFDSTKIDASKFWTELESGYIQRQIVECRLSEKTFWVLATFTPLYDIEGNIDKVFMIGYDYTDQMNASVNLKEKSARNVLLEKKEVELEKSLKHVNVKFEELNNNYLVYDGLVNKLLAKVVLDKDANVLEANDQLYSIFELKEKSVVGRNLVELSSFDSSAEFTEFWQNLLTKEFYDRTFVYQNKLFKEFYYVNKDPIYKYKVYNFIISVNLPAEMAEYEGAVRKSKLAKSVESNLLIAEYESDGRVASFSEKLLKLFKLSEKDIKNKNHKDFAVVDNVLKYHVLWSKLRVGEPLAREYSYEVNGMTFFFLDNYFPVKNNQHEVEKVVVYSQDITSLRDRITKLTKSLDDFKKGRK